MAKRGALGLARLAAGALSALLGAGCAGLPPLAPAKDALSADEHLRLGASYEAQGLRKEAADQYAAAARRDPRLAAAWIASGNIAFESEDWAAAERCYRRALKAAPGHPGASNNLAMVYLARGKDLARAESLARVALQGAGPLEPYALDTLANVYAREGRWDEARGALARAEAAAPVVDAGFRARLERTRRAVER
ncbi:MAG TPA: tetratricopeptide repeat protein [Elusimicrobiota bacterium]|jgi:tetratricopeptide (TPR) repeat protein|nr:tetratricopeptide repeat protein [Elusimicrobiota bacterium]